MNHNIINKDYAYCSGVTCPIRKECNRYLPNPPDEPLWWISPAFNDKVKRCTHFEQVNMNVNEELQNE